MDNLECVSCGHELASGFDEGWLKIYECPDCGRIYNTANYSIGEWANMFDLDPVTVANDWGLEYEPDQSE